MAASNISRTESTLLYFFLLITLPVWSNASLSVVIEPGTEQCLVVRAPGGEPSHITGNYDMLDDDLSPDPVTAVLYDNESKSIWHSKPGYSEGSFSITGKGRYYFCLGNGSDPYYEIKEEVHVHHPHKDHHIDDDQFNYENTDGKARNIGFSVRVRPAEGTFAAREMQRRSKSADTVDPKDGPTEVDMQADLLMTLSFKLSDKMELLMDHQQYLKNREAKHRDIAEQTFSLVLKWTLLEAGVLIVVASAQVLYLRKFFETKRYL